MNLGKDLLDIDQLDEVQIKGILESARQFKDVSSRAIKKLPTLRGKTVSTLFFEPSTRTRISFELAAKRLSADVVSFSVATSSRTKNESLIDTVRTLEVMGVDLFIVRHGVAGACHQIARMTSASVLNGGDGAHAHPTQALLDLYTLQEHRGSLEGARVLIVGDILYSRVARSNIHGLLRMGAHVTLVGPPTLIPIGIEKMGVSVSYDLDASLPGADVVMMLRLQNERQQAGLLPSIREYVNLYQLTPARLRRASPGCIVMHPGPMNRGVEIHPQVADGRQSVIEEQVANGVAVRMALLYLLMANRSQVPPGGVRRATTLPGGLTT